ncbi:hypothetical protein GQ602_000929 [Ophiocordyceps camponoti-floridani]|uniref:Uncharacterized protein n=1 Tax=Ophiocordyceps camponoti-floridani TaxID=2030778 RepID=A0A8H4QD41_9HYPO|nr:hypothetical protein GQ602_000929 [Ophiocordyceps camponoti-floridani]
MDQGIQQPDFSLMANNLSQVAVHLGRCAHLPAIDGGVYLAQTLQTVLERISALERTMVRRFDESDRRMNSRFDEVDRRVTAANKNSTARMRNSVVTRRSDDLSPLYNAISGARITRFPRKLRDLENLNEDRVNAILEELEEPVEGNADERKRWLKYAVGVTT